MDKARLLITLLVCVFISSSVWGQKAKLQRANDEFSKFNYIVAIPLYKEVLEKTDIAEAKINLAECYRKTGNSEEAEYWYGQIVHLPDAEPSHFLFYGMALQANGKCELAKEWFAEYAEKEPDDLRGQLLAKTCEPQELQRLLKKSEKLYEVMKLPINTEFDDFGPVYYKDGLVFASERDNSGIVKREFEWTGYPFLELYFSQVDTIDAENLEFSYQKNADKFQKKLNTKYHDGPIAFSPDFKKIYLTRNNHFKGKTLRDEEGIVRLKIFIGENNNGNWTNLKELPFNSDEYSVAHPTLSADGKTLYFSSDMPSGFGGMDLYSSEYDEEGDTWSPPKNLGPRINTEGHEVFPYYHQPTGKLYFSSDGHIGLGKLDLQYIQKIDDVWGPVTNAGSPLNSPDDDLGIILNDEETFGYFTSNREGGEGRDDIYSFKKSAVKARVIVYDQNTNEPIPAATVFNDCSLETYTMNEQGESLIELPLNECCSLTANKETYLENIKEECTEGYVAGQEIVVRIPLTQPLEFALEGVVTDAETGEPISMAVVTLKNDCDQDVREFITAADGRYHFDDLAMDCCYYVAGSKVPVYLASKDEEVCTRGKTKSENFTVDIVLETLVFADARKNGRIGPDGKIIPEGGGGNTTNNPTNPTDTYTGGGNPTTRVINPATVDPGTITSDDGIVMRTFVLRHIYYDFDKYYIRDDAQPDLNKLLDIMERNPKYIVEVGSHTDARGSRDYNKWLARKRAKAAVEWLIERGIPRERLRRQGYGESEPTNGCFDDVKCSEEEHQRNRRTEFVVVGTTDGIEFVRSTPRTDMDIDPCVGCPF